MPEITPEVLEKETVTPPVDSATEHSTKEPIQQDNPLNRMINRYKGEQPAIKPAPTPVVLPELKEEFIKDLSPDELKKYKEMPLDESMRVHLIETANNMTKYNRLQNERDVRIKELEKLVPSEQRTQREQEFINGLKVDFKGTIERFKDEFELPDAESLVGQVLKANDLNSKMSAFQQTDLVPKLEKKYKLEQGTFVYDPNDAHTPGTPSYEYRVNTEMHEKKLLQDQIENDKRVSEATKQVEDERLAQTENLYKTFFSEREIKPEMTAEEKTQVAQENQKAKDEFVSMLGHIDNMFVKMRETKSFTPDVNPIAISNIFKGVFFDKLAKAEVDKAIADVHAQYRQKGMYLPDGNGKPPVTDFSRISSKPAIPVMSEDALKNSPLLRSINRTINK